MRSMPLDAGLQKTQGCATVSEKHHYRTFRKFLEDAKLRVEGSPVNFLSLTVSTHCSPVAVKQILSQFVAYTSAFHEMLIKVIFWKIDWDTYLTL